MTEFTAPSGAKIVINLAPWKDAKNLKKAVQKEAAAAGLDMNTSMESAILRLDGSDLIDAALWPCLVRCTRNDEKIVESTFDSAEGRKDYYDIVMACMKENLGPLVESLFSKFADLGQKQASADQKSPSETTSPS